MGHGVGKQLIKSALGAVVVVALFWACVAVMTPYEYRRRPVFSPREGALSLFLIAALTAGDFCIRQRRRSGRQ